MEKMNVKFFIGKKRCSRYFVDRRVYDICGLNRSGIFSIDHTVSEDRVEALGSELCLFKAIRQAVSKKTGKTLIAVVPIEKVSDIDRYIGPESLDNQNDNVYGTRFLLAVNSLMNSDHDLDARMQLDFISKRFMRQYNAIVKKEVQDETINIHQLFEIYRKPPEFAFETAQFILDTILVETELKPERCKEDAQYSYKSAETEYGYRIFNQTTESFVFLSAQEIVKYWCCFKDVPGSIGPTIKRDMLFLAIDHNKVKGTSAAKMVDGFGEIDSHKTGLAKLSIEGIAVYIPRNKLPGLTDCLENIEIFSNYILPRSTSWKLESEFLTLYNKALFLLQEKMNVLFKGIPNPVNVPAVIMAREYTGECVNATLGISGDTRDALRVVALSKE